MSRESEESGYSLPKKQLYHGACSGLWKTGHWALEELRGSSVVENDCLLDGVLDEWVHGRAKPLMLGN